MNQTIKNSIGRMTIPERLEVLRELSLSTPEILNYLIQAHDKGLIEQKNVPEKVKNNWTSIRNQLANILDISFPGWKPL